jgi:nucleotide-binding universal stress UspA family protein
MCAVETDETDRPIRLIVVGVDGSDGSALAVRWAARLAGATGAEVVAVHALGSQPFTHGFPFVGATAYDDWQVAWKEWREQMLEIMETSWCRPLAEEGVAFRVEAVDGGPEALIERANSMHADMLVVGRRGRGGFAELVLGSFSHQLVHHAEQPVVVVPNDRSEGGAG